jgi:hypothetical protein
VNGSARLALTTLGWTRQIIERSGSNVRWRPLWRGTFAKEKRGSVHPMASKNLHQCCRNTLNCGNGRVRARSSIYRTKLKAELSDAAVALTQNAPLDSRTSRGDALARRRTSCAAGQRHCCLGVCRRVGVMRMLTVLNLLVVVPPQCSGICFPGHILLSRDRH